MTVRVKREALAGSSGSPSFLARSAVNTTAHRRRLDLIDRRAFVGRDRLAAMLNGYLGHGAVHEGEKRLLDDDVRSQILIANDLHLGRERTNDGIREKDTRERSDECGGNEVAQDFRRLVDGAHRLHDT